MILGIYIISIIVYFLTIRYLLKEDAFAKIDATFVVMILILGLIPMINMLLTIGFYIAFRIIAAELTAEDILKKILFIKKEIEGDTYESN